MEFTNTHTTETYKAYRINNLATQNVLTPLLFSKGIKLENSHLSIPLFIPENSPISKVLKTFEKGAINALNTDEPPTLLYYQNLYVNIPTKVCEDVVTPAIPIYDEDGNMIHDYTSYLDKPISIYAVLDLNNVTQDTKTSKFYFRPRARQLKIKLRNPETLCQSVRNLTFPDF